MKNIEISDNNPGTPKRETTDNVYIFIGINIFIDDIITLSPYRITNARLTFDKGNCDSVVGSSTLYTRKGATAVYTGLMETTTTGTIPTATKNGYTFNGWYTASSGGTKILNANGSFTGSAVTNYTNANSWQTVANQTLFAQCTPNTYTATIEDRKSVV